jgi:hypothetical protein
MIEKFNRFRLIRPPVKKHPEQEDDEIFICFETKESFKKIGWKTKRLGKQGYDLIPMLLRDELIPVKQIYPMFVKRREITEYRERKFIKEEDKKK